MQTRIELIPLLFPVLVACAGQDTSPQDADWSVGLVEPAAPITAPEDSEVLGLNSSVAPGVDPQSTGNTPPVERPTNDAILHCTTSVFDYGDGPEVVRLEVYGKEGSFTVVAERGVPHPGDSSADPVTVVHTDASVQIVDGWMDMYFGMTSVWGWTESSASGEFYNGGLYGLEACTTSFDPDLPAPPPCGYEAEISCWTSDIEPAFTYDPVEGKCLNDADEEGSNYRSVAFVRETGDGECANLAWTALDEGNLAGPELTQWDLRGANLSNASLHFATLTNAQLEGANFTDMSYGYANISGTIDAHTTLPTQGCEAADGMVFCSQ